MSRENEVFDVIIIGCGASGIGTAIEFEKGQSKMKYVILEAQDRIGGRTFTDRRTFGEDIPVDLGAHYLCHQQEKHFFSEFYSPSEKDFLESDVYDARTMKICDKDGNVISNQLINEGMKFVEDLFLFVKEYGSENDDDYDDVSIYDLIEPKLDQIEDPKMKDIVQLFLAYTELHEGSDLNRLSAKWYEKGEGDLEQSDLCLSNGYGTLVEQIASKFDLPIELNCIVTKIDASNELIRLSTKNNRSYLCKYVLLTTPLGCLKSHTIEFYPSLPQWKNTAIEKMGLALLNRIYLQFSQIFWEKHLRRITVLHPRFKFYYCLPKYRMLALYVYGDIARQLEEQSDEEIVNDIVKSLAPNYPLISYPIRWLITRWENDPFSKGSYSSFHLGNDFHTLKELSRETHDGKIHWAGEHTNFDGSIGYVHSAFQTGIREANLILEKLYP